MHRYYYYYIYIYIYIYCNKAFTDTLQGYAVMIISCVCVVWLAVIVETTTSRGGTNVTAVRRQSQKAWVTAAWTEVSLTLLIEQKQFCCTGRLYMNMDVLQWDTYLIFTLCSF